MSDKFKKPDRHIRNTDNEETQFFKMPSDNQNTAEIRIPNNRQSSGQPVRRQENYRQPQEYGNPPQQEYYRRQNGYGDPQQENYRSRPQQQSSRSSYYDHDSPINKKRAPSEAQQRQEPRRQQPNRPEQPRKNQPPKKNGSPRPPQSQPKKKKRKKKLPIIAKILITLLIIFALIFGLYSCAALSVIRKLNYEPSDSRSHSSEALSASYVTSILLVGTDGRTADERGRSDTMILLSINKKTDKITLTSFMRDSYVNVPGHGWDKLTNSYSYGGIDLLMETIENNFKVRIDDYLLVNFTSFAAIVDAVGGVEIDVSDAEATEINTILQAEVNEIMGDAVDSDLLKKGGKLRLNGKQALSYARIRHVGNADFERTERQRTVLTQIAKNIKSIKFSGIKEITSKAVPQVTTNMSTGKLYWLSLRLPFLIGSDIEQVRVPAEGTYHGSNESCGSVLVVDFDENYKLLQDEVFSDK